MKINYLILNFFLCDTFVHSLVFLGGNIEYPIFTTRVPKDITKGSLRPIDLISMYYAKLLYLRNNNK